MSDRFKNNLRANSIRIAAANENHKHNIAYLRDQNSARDPLSLVAVNVELILAEVSETSQPNRMTILGRKSTAYGEANPGMIAKGIRSQ